MQIFDCVGQVGTPNLRIVKGSTLYGRADQIRAPSPHLACTFIQLPSQLLRHHYVTLRFLEAQHSDSVQLLCFIQQFLVCNWETLGSDIKLVKSHLITAWTNRSLTFIVLYLTINTLVFIVTVDTFRNNRFRPIYHQCIT